MAIIFSGKMFKSNVKKAVLDNNMLYQFWKSRKTDQLHKEYLARRERYYNAAQLSGFVYSEQDTAGRVRQKVSARGYHVALKTIGHIKTYVFIPMRSGHANLVHDLNELGPVVVYNYENEGHAIRTLYKADSAAIEAKKAINEAFVNDFRKQHAIHQFDWLFIYASGYEIAAASIRAIQEEFGLPVVSLCMDDKQSWTGPFMGDHRAGQIDIAGVFDLSVTTALETVNWYHSEGGIPLYLPEGFSTKSYFPIQHERNIPVSFVGNNYGARRDVITRLRRFDINVATFGSGWDQGWVKDDNLIFNTSIINLGIGGIGYSEELTNVKGRDFDIPGSGGGMYLTTYNKDLARHFDIGKDIICYKNEIELVELIRYYTSRPAEAAEIAENAYRRSISEHRWLHRYLSILEILGIVKTQ